MEVLMPNATQQILANTTADTVTLYCQSTLKSAKEKLKKAGQGYEYLGLLVVEDSELRQGIKDKKIIPIEYDTLFIDEFKACLKSDGSHRALLNATDNNGVSLLMLALACGNEEIANFLVQEGADSDKTYNYKTFSTLYQHRNHEEVMSNDATYIIQDENTKAIAKRQGLTATLYYPKLPAIFPKKMTHMYAKGCDIKSNVLRFQKSYDISKYFFYSSIALALIIAAGKATTEPPKLSCI